MSALTGNGAQHAHTPHTQRSKGHCICSRKWTHVIFIVTPFQLLSTRDKTPNKKYILETKTTMWEFLKT